MGGEIEAIGTLATGSLVAHAVGGGAHEGGPGETDQLHTCQNCGATLAGPFCHTCGQSGHVHRTIGHVLEEFAHGVFHVDSKGWRTLPMLIVNPGRLTRDYIHGRRARYIAPLALFLFMMFLTFSTFGLTGGQVVGAPDTPEAQRAEAVKTLEEARRELASAARNPDSPPEAQAALGKWVAASHKRLDQLTAPPVVGVSVREDKSRSSAAGPQWAEALKRQNARGKFRIDTGYPSFDARIRRALADPEFAAYKMEEKASKLSFLLVPLTLPILWLLFAGRREANLYDHTVFALYSLSFMSLLMVTMLLLGRIGLGVVATSLLFVPPLHMFVQMKGAYRLSVGGALWRTAVLGTASMVVLGVFFALTVVAGLVD